MRRDLNALTEMSLAAANCSKLMSVCLRWGGRRFHGL